MGPWGLFQYQNAVGSLCKFPLYKDCMTFITGLQIPGKMVFYSKTLPVPLWYAWLLSVGEVLCWSIATLVARGKMGSVDEKLLSVSCLKWILWSWRQGVWRNLEEVLVCSAEVMAPTSATTVVNEEGWWRGTMSKTCINILTVAGWGAGINF